MDAALSVRAGRALGAHQDVTFDERRLVVDAVERALDWNGLPHPIQQLIEEIEARPLREDIPPEMLNPK